jgi:hypothetical protein
MILGPVNDPDLAIKAIEQLMECLEQKDALIKRAADLLHLGHNPAWQWIEGRKRWLIDAGMSLEDK